MIKITERLDNVKEVQENVNGLVTKLENLKNAPSGFNGLLKNLGILTLTERRELLETLQAQLDTQFQVLEEQEEEQVKEFLKGNTVVIVEKKIGKDWL